MADTLLRKYGEATTINYELFEVDGVNFRTDAPMTSADIFIMKDEGVEATADSTPVDEGRGYSLALTATEMQAARIMVYIEDQTATKVFLDKAIRIETYGNASAQHAFDLDTASVAQTGDNFARIGAPAGASISDDIAGTRSDLTIVGNDAAGSRSDLNNGTDGLTAIKAVVDGAATAVEVAATQSQLAVVDGNVDTILANYSTAVEMAATQSQIAVVDANVDTLITNVPDIVSLANINAEVDTALATTTYAEPAQGAPGATISLKDKIGFIYKFMRNKADNDGTTLNIYNDDATTVDHKSTLSEAAGTVTRGEFETGP